MSETFGYPHPIQVRILASMLFDPNQLVSGIDLIRPDSFDHPALQDLSSIILQFYKKYKRGIQLEELESEFESLIQQAKKIPEQEYRETFSAVLEAGVGEGLDYARDKLVDFARFQAVKNAIADAEDILRRGRNYGDILSRVQEAMMVGEAGSDVGVFYFRNLEPRLQKRLSGESRADRAIGTGAPELDRKLGGGLGRGELGVIMGPMKRGKTQFSVNLAYGAMKNGVKVAHYIMEGSEDRLQVLYDARVTGIPKDKVAHRDYIDEVRSRVETFYGRPGIERLVIKHFPSQSCSPLSIESHINRLALYGFDPELIIIDYLGLMVSAHKGVARTGDRYLMYGQITKELLSLAQRGGYAIWLLHQSTRGSKKKATIDMDDSADSIEPMRDADLVLTLNQPSDPEGTSDFSSSVHLTVFIAGGREVPDRAYVDLELDKNTCVIKEI